MLAFHGIGAYRGQKDVFALKGMLDTALSGVELCAADRPIRAFGILAEGKATVAYSDDCFSVLKNGERFPTRVVREVSDDAPVDNLATTDGIIAEVVSPSKGTIRLMSDSAQKQDGSKGYIEIFFRCENLRAIWVKDWASSATKKAAAIFAKNRGVPMITVTGSTRPWDIDLDTPGNDNFQQPTIGDIIKC